MKKRIGSSDTYSRWTWKENAEPTDEAGVGEDDLLKSHVPLADGVWNSEIKTSQNVKENEGSMIRITGFGCIVAPGMNQTDCGYVYDFYYGFGFT